jgi:PAS domain-containing protein
MLEKNEFPPKALLSETMGAKEPGRFDCPDYVKGLFAAGERAAHMGICLLDNQTRFEWVNAALANETRATVDQHIGKTSREIVGDLATQVEPIYERVLRTGKPASVWLAGHVRDTIEAGHWLDYCFPIPGSSHRVQKLGLFVVNVTAEKESAAIFDALAKNLPFAVDHCGQLLRGLDEAIQGYYLGLELSFLELSRHSAGVARNVDQFRSKLQQLDAEIRLIRELVYTIIDQFRIPSC